MDQSTPQQTRLTDAFRWGGAGVIALVAVMRCIIVFAEPIIFDVDPAFDPSRLAGLGPAGSLALDVLLLLACAAGLWGELRSGRGVSWALLLLALIPAPLVLMHGGSDFGDLWKGSTWASAMIACVTVAHLVRDRSLKIAIVSLLLAACAPLLVRGVGQLTYEHSELIEMFEANKDRFLQEKGWTPESSSARIYERRLRNAEPLGWFATTNIFASVIITGIAAFGALVVASVRSKLPGGWSAALGLLLLVAGYELWRCQAKGAMAALAAGLAILVLPILAGWIRTVMQRWGGGLVLAGLGLVLLAVAARGTLLNEDFGGDRSMLFRWHYLVAATGVAANAPLTGVGPDGFQDAYTAHRVARNPEEVSSAHSMFVDWICTLGVAGLAWIALLAALLWRVGTMLESNADEPPVDTTLARRVLWIAIGIAAFGMGLGMLIEWRVSADPLIVLLRGLGALGYVAVATIGAGIMCRSDSRMVHWGLVAGVAALLVHGQIEMTFVQPGAVVWALAMVGATGVVRLRPAGRGQVAVPALLIGLALWIGGTGLIPGWRQEAAMHDIAASLREFPRDTPSRLALRRQVSAALLEAHAINPAYAHPQQRASQQLLFVARRLVGEEKIALLRDALDIAGAPSPDEPSWTIGLRGSILHMVATTSGDADDWDAAQAQYQRLVLRDPHSNMTWKRYADTLWDGGRTTSAGRAYRHALEADDAFSLDPMKQFSEADRMQAEARATPPSNAAPDGPSFDFSIPGVP